MAGVELLLLKLAIVVDRKIVKGDDLGDHVVDVANFQLLSVATEYPYTPLKVLP